MSDTLWRRTENGFEPIDLPPKEHSSTTTAYGKGDGSNYGHVKLSNLTNGTSDDSSGIAATPKAVSSALALALRNSGTWATSEAVMMVKTDAYNPSLILAKANGETLVRLYAIRDSTTEYGGFWIRVWRDASNRRDFKFLPDGTFEAPIAIKEGNTLLSAKYAPIGCKSAASKGIWGSCTFESTTGSGALATGLSSITAVAISCRTLDGAKKCPIFAASISGGNVTVLAHSTNGTTGSIAFELVATGTL